MDVEHKMKMREMI